MGSSADGAIGQGGNIAGLSLAVVVSCSVGENAIGEKGSVGGRSVAVGEVSVHCWENISMLDIADIAVQ